MTPSVVTTWYGSFLVEGTEVLRSVRAPRDPSALADRVRLRREGHLTPEEDALLADRRGAMWSTRDRRLSDHGLRWSADAPAPSPDLEGGSDRAILRAAMLADADRALAAAWDPSVHVQEAVRATADLDRVRNLLGERLGSWVSRDSPDVDPGDHSRAAEVALASEGASAFAPVEPALRDSRRRLAELFRSVEATRSALDQAVTASAPQRTPNLAGLLGPELAARLVAQAGGLDRLARLPASTIQVLGAEKAFFEHLRGRAPPPRHGLLFLHPAIQSSPRSDRGRLARALAGKVAIAARLDRAGAPIHPSLERSFAARREAVRARRASRKSTGAGGRRSRPPLHRAPEDR